MLIVMHTQTQMVGSETQKVVYSIGCPQRRACIHLLSSQSLQHLLPDRFPLILMSLHLGHHGPKSSREGRPSLFTLCGPGDCSSVSLCASLGVSISCNAITKYSFLHV